MLYGDERDPKGVGALAKTPVMADQKLDDERLSWHDLYLIADGSTPFASKLTITTHGDVIGITQRCVPLARA